MAEIRMEVLLGGARSEETVTDVTAQLSSVEIRQLGQHFPAGSYLTTLGIGAAGALTFNSDGRELHLILGALDPAHATTPPCVSVPPFLG